MDPTSAITGGTPTLVVLLVRRVVQPFASVEAHSIVEVLGQINVPAPG